MAVRKDDKSYVKAARRRGNPGRWTAIVTLAAFQKEIEDPRDVLKKIGVMLRKQTTRAFTDQKSPAGTPWEPRYPGQASPKLNVAGALADFNLGKKKPASVRFQDRPALRNTNLLKNWWGDASKQSAWYKGKYIVVVGVAGDIAHYATRMQEGGTDEQDITPTAKKGIYHFIYGGKKAAKFKGFKDTKKKTKEIRQRESDAVQLHMGWMLNKSTNPTKLTTDVVPRPFLEIGPETERQINRIVTQEIQKKMKKAGGK
jgi:phage gpG-like protein